MVPNSLGPGELIEKYGTPEQKQHYLPRLAKGLEIPCFSLTGPTSGSDAATMRDVGYVTRGRHDGKEVLGIRLSWDKRYITLAPNATLVGLAFRLFDPENLLGTRRGHRHHRGAAFRPTIRASRSAAAICPPAPPSRTGRTGASDVFIPMDWVIGGEKMAGQGWRMLMECLAAGPLHLAAVVIGSGRQVAAAQYVGLCPHPQAVRPADRQDGGARGAAGAHGRDRLRQRGRARRHGVDGRAAARSRR